MKTLKVKCPAKINLGLKVVNKRPDGFHNIDSVMQTINLYDYLTISVDEAANENEILLSGNSAEIPYDESNLVYKAAKLFLDSTDLPACMIKIDIEKHIPIAAGLAGGSTDAAGTLYGLNKLFDEPLTDIELHNLCAKLGSDLNVCLKGGCLKTSGRGEIIEPAEYKEFRVRLMKPLDLGISAKEAYTKFSQKLQKGEDLETRDGFVNDLEWAIIKDYEELQFVKRNYPQSVMTGSGSTYFSLSEDFESTEGYWVNNTLTTTPDGVAVCSI